MSIRTNLCRNPSSKVAGATGSLANYGGTGSGRVTGLTGFPDRTTGYRFVGSSAATHSQSATLTKNVAYTFSTYVKPEFSGSLQANINWYRNGSYYDTTSGDDFPLTNGSVTRVYCTGTAPNVSGTLTALLNLVDKAGTVVSAQTLYEVGTVLSPYGDGDSPGGAWSGTAGLSTSTFEGTSGSAVNVFPPAAEVDAAARDASVTRVSSSPFPDVAPFGLEALNASVRVIGEGPPLDLPPPTPEPVWTIYVRNRDLLREAQVDDYSSLTCVARFNDVGTWELRLDRRSAAADALTAQGAGIEIRRDDVVIMTGPVTRLRRDRSDRSNQLTVSGVDDNVWLERRLAHPQPGSSSPPYNSQADDVRTGVGSTVIWEYVNVNLGPGAITPRQLPTLTMAADPEVGEEVNGRARYDQLLELIQKLAITAGDIGFKISQVDDGLVFTVYPPEDKSDSVVFSEGFANLSSFTYESQAPTYTYVYGGGDGEGVEREIVEGQDPAAIVRWGRIERLVDAREKEDGPEVSEQIDAALQENSEKLSLELTPVDTTYLKYGEHYQLGDKVSAVIDGVIVSDIVREVEVNLTPSGPQRLTPVLGSVARSSLLALFEAVRDLNSRTRNLERR